MTKTSFLKTVGALALAAIVLPTAVLAGGVEKVDGFVCPVFTDKSAAGEKNPNAVAIAGGDYTIIGPDVSVPARATNGNGAGRPSGPHSSPGDTDYTAIWAGH